MLKRTLLSIRTTRRLPRTQEQWNRWIHKKIAKSGKTPQEILSELRALEQYILRPAPPPKPPLGLCDEDTI